MVTSIKNGKYVNTGSVVKMKKRKWQPKVFFKNLTIGMVIAGILAGGMAVTGYALDKDAKVQELKMQEYWKEVRGE